MKKNPLVSVIIPTYNNEEFIADALDSVIQQTYSSTEIIVINDGSTDDTDKIISRYLDKIIYIKQENKGPAATRNAGIKLAKGEYIAFLDADDIWVPQKLERQIDLTRQRPDTVMIYARMAQFDHQTNRELGIRPDKTYSGKIFNQLLLENFILLSTVFLRAEIIKQVGMFNENLQTAEDTNLWLRIARQHEIVGMEDVLVRRRKHADNLSDNMNISVGTLDNLDHLVSKFPETDPQEYPPMKLAYIVRGTALANDSFCSGNYKLCHDVCQRLIRTKCLHSRIFILFIATLFPSTVIDLLRKITKRFRPYGYQHRDS